MGEDHTHQKHIVIVGGGIAGLEIASALGRYWGKQRKENTFAPLVTLIDRDLAHIWKPMLHTIAAGTRDVSQQQTSFIAQARDAGFTFQLGEVVGLNRDQQEIQVASLYAPDGRLLVPACSIKYDKLIFAVGSQANDFGTPGVVENCMMIDSRMQANAFNEEIKLRILQCAAQDLELSIAIVGGGATGVELAAELVQLTESAMSYGAKSLSSRIKITLIESGPRLLAAFPEDISEATKLGLEKIGVQVLNNTRVNQVTPEGLLFDNGEFFKASLKVWAAGVKAPNFLSKLDRLTTTRNNQLVVLPSLQTTADPNVYAVGDCASLIQQETERALPPTAQVAHQQAQHLIRHLPFTIKTGNPPPDFQFNNFGALVSLGEYDAFGSLGTFGIFKGVTFRGKLAQLSHVMLYRSHQSRIHGFWKGGLLWLVDLLNARLRARIRLD